MFLHLGGEVLVQAKDIIAIIDIDKNNSKITKNFIDTAKEEGFLEKIGEDDYKTIIVAEVNNKSKVFLSSISSMTIHKRANYINEISND